MRKSELATVLGTVASGIAAVVALIISIVTLDMQIKAQKEQEDERAAYSAGRTSWWIDNLGEGEYVISIQNASNQPIAATIIQHEGVKSLIRGIRPVPASISIPHESLQRRGEIWVMKAGTVPPCRVAKLTINTLHSDIAGFENRVTDASMVIVDSNHNAWVRTSEGLLFKADAWFDHGLGLKSNAEDVVPIDRKLSKAEGCGPS